LHGSFPDEMIARYYHEGSQRAMTSENPNQALWEKGDFTQIARAMRDSGEALVASIGVSPGMDVLDLGCGDGTTAVPEAQAGANVLGVDIAENLVAAGTARAQELGLDNLTFQWGDATNLSDLADDSFDLVVSIFGAMFAPRPHDVAKEMVRVARPGGRIVMGNWIPGDPTFVAQLLKVSATYSPPPPEGFVSPVTWGVEENVLERFGSAGISPESIDCERVMFVFESPRTPEQYLEDFRDYYGPTMNAYAAAAADERERELHAELAALVDEHNTATDSGTRIEAAYLRVTVSV
jgi:SAM-dependent methyltransferase